MLGLRFWARAFSSCGERGPLFIAVRGPLAIAASPVAEHRLPTRRLSSCGSRAQLLRGMWDLPRPGLEPVSPALAGRFSTTAPPGKPRNNSLYFCLEQTPAPKSFIQEAETWNQSSLVGHSFLWLLPCSLLVLLWPWLQISPTLPLVRPTFLKLW